MLTFNGKVIPFGSFPNGESYVHATYFDRHRAHASTGMFDAGPPVPPRNVVTLKYENDADLFKLWLVREAITFPCTLRITYFPYSRMDRDNGSYIFSLKFVTKYINLMNWSEVIVYEPHSDVTPALLDRCKVIPVIPTLLKKVVLSDYQLFYPDAGAQKRYSVGNETELVGFKRRDFESGKIAELNIVGKLVSETVVIVDDLCSKGGTFILAAEKLRELGAKQIILVVAHCEKTIFDGTVLTSELIQNVITTDSILDNNQGYGNKLMIIPINEIPW